jgi:DNA-binding protein HU-beta
MAEKKPLTKAQIVDNLAASLSATKKDVNIFLSAYNDLIYKEVKKTKELTVPGLGKFYVAKTKNRKGRNPATGAEISIPAKTVVKFKVGKACKDAIVPPTKK